MTVLAPPHPTETIHYPESDGQPMADNTLQFRWIVTLHGGLDALFANRPDVFVAGDLLWYPVEGDNKTRAAPDVLVVFGRPKGDRGSYLQWLEDNLPPHVVFEVLSPGNSIAEMTRKFSFYQRYGVEEYYLYDPDRGELSGWVRKEGQLESINEMQGWVSPRLGVRFEMKGGELKIYRPDGQPFETYTELASRAAQAEARAAQEAEARRAAEAELARLREELARLRGESGS
jgi:Uma2 family endonuclease